MKRSETAIKKINAGEFMAFNMDRLEGNSLYKKCAVFNTDNQKEILLECLRKGEYVSEDEDGNETVYFIHEDEIDE